MQNQKIRRLTVLSMLLALALVSAAIINFPLIPAVPFMRYDPADIPIFIATFMFGTSAGLGLTVGVAILQGLLVNSDAGPIGIIMHILATGSFVLTAGLIYRHSHTRRGAYWSLVAGSIVMTLVMVGCNLLLTPLFLGAPLKRVIELLLPAIIPFNLLKAAINSILTALLYKPISHLFKDQNK